MHSLVQSIYQTNGINCFNNELTDVMSAHVVKLLAIKHFFQNFSAPIFHPVLLAVASNTVA